MSPCGTITRGHTALALHPFVRSVNNITKALRCSKVKKWRKKWRLLNLPNFQTIINALYLVKILHSKHPQGSTYSISQTLISNLCWAKDQQSSFSTLVNSKTWEIWSNESAFDSWRQLDPVFFFLLCASQWRRQRKGPVLQTHLVDLMQCVKS